MIWNKLEGQKDVRDIFKISRLGTLPWQNGKKGTLGYIFRDWFSSRNASADVREKMLEEGTIYPRCVERLVRRGRFVEKLGHAGEPQHRASPRLAAPRLASPRRTVDQERNRRREVDGEKLLAGLDGAEITARRSAECAPR